MNPRTDVVKHYKMVPEDFVKHLFSTLVIVSVVVLFASLVFGVPEKPPLTIKGYATSHPLAFEQMALRALDGQGQIASYGPPYNHGTSSVQSPLQTMVGVIHPVNAASDFILKPLRMAAAINPGITPALNRFRKAPKLQQAQWEAAYTAALQKSTYRNGRVLTTTGNFGPLPALLNETLALGKSGLMSGALIRNGSVMTRFDNQNYLLFLQGAPLQQDPATQQLAGGHWGIIHPAINGYPAAWWMTIPTWIYQWPFVAHSKAPDALALTIGLFFWLALALTPWIPGWNRLPRYLGVHRLIWRDFYRAYRKDPREAKDVSRNAS